MYSTTSSCLIYVDYLISGEAVDLMLPDDTDDTTQEDSEESEEEVKTFTKKEWITEMR